MIYDQIITREAIRQLRNCFKEHLLDLESSDSGQRISVDFIFDPDWTLSTCAERLKPLIEQMAEDIRKHSSGGVKRFFLIPIEAKKDWNINIQTYDGVCMVGRVSVFSNRKIKLEVSVR